MPSVQIKNVPDEVHHVLRQRAVLANQSLQEYLLALLSEHARKPTLGEIFRKLEQHTGGSLTTAFAVEAQRADRDSR